MNTTKLDPLQKGPEIRVLSLLRIVDQEQFSCVLTPPCAIVSYKPFHKLIPLQLRNLEYKLKCPFHHSCLSCRSFAAPETMDVLSKACDLALHDFRWAELQATLLYSHHLH